MRNDEIDTLLSAQGDDANPSESASKIIAQVIKAGETPVFGDMLKEFLFERYAPDGKRKDIALETYAEYIIREFSYRQVPAHFDLATGSLRKLSRNWLSRNSVSRKAVLIMGFGLGLSLNEVDRFLTEGILEHALNPKDPFETLCWYCFKNALGFATFEQMWYSYTYNNNALGAWADPNETTDRLRKMRDKIDSDEKLYDYLRLIAVLRDHKAQSRTARRHFKRLFTECVNMLCPDKEPIAEDDTENTSAGAGMIENELYMTVPRDKNGNLRSVSNTALSSVLRYNRLSRQHIRSILTGQADISRSDLITLCFLRECISAHSPNENERAARFFDVADSILLDCGMSPVNRKIPYELLLSLCLEHTEPLNEFADVMEICFNGAQGEEDD